ncbi:hypothetical protein CMI47_19645 [Candidatus Pacearchaeota archaeon]|jgi:hypothetical protein|nr:hypothetical protein [Candidatus Pacearchaeota archaeon]|tara:strand:- start:4440 stop:4619 length:180 start_codon:yes stop_codon:yes gene_type:complete
MSTTDHTDIIIQSLSQDIAQLQERAQLQEMMIMQIIETLAAVGIISFEEEEEESSIIEP